MGGISMQKLEVMQYLNILGLKEEQPSYTFLAKIVRAHVFCFPFENIGKVINFDQNTFQVDALPTLAEFIEQFNQYQFGGTCYVLNSMLNQLLNELGFTSYNIHLGKDHLAIIVTLNGEHIFVDCGVAAPIFTPVRIEKNHMYEFTYNQETIHIRHLSKQNYEFARFIKRKLTEDCWTFSTNPTDPSFIKDMVRRSHQPTATYMSELRCQLWKKSCNMRIRNNQLRIYYPDGTTEKRVFKTSNEIEECVHNEFGFSKLPVKRAISILEASGIHIFQQEDAAKNSIEEKV